MSDNTLQRLIADITPEKRRMLAELLGSTREPIAIVGMACRFPGGANSPEAFWRLLEQGVDTVTEVPSDRWNVDDYYDPDPRAPGKASTRCGGFLDQVDQFDAAFFGLTPRETGRIDPQHRLLLEVSWEALEDAGQSADRLMGTDTGVFAGLSTNDYWWLQIPDIATFDGYAALGGAHCVATGRVSYHLDLRGPNVAVDTACSSSLVAVHLACQSLASKECDLALAGGVNVMASPITPVALSKWGVLAPDGRCKTFDKNADGFSRGEGCGIVVLKRLSDALADQDRILAVIYGSATNQDGRSTRFSAPNGRAQQAVVQKAIENARVDPSQISLIEAHGTGTSLGDPIEVEALKAVVGQPRSNGTRCALGSVKTNIGHLEAAAGIAGLIKTVLCLQHETIPPHVHLRELNPGIELDGSPFFIPQEKTPWAKNGVPRYAGISSFGLSGTNAHLVVGEAPVCPEQPKADPAQAYLLPISARSAAALEAVAKSYQEWLSSPATANVSLEDVCYSASVRRSHHPYRSAVVGSNKEELAERLGDFARQPTVGPPVFVSPRVVFVFSGQGSQWAGMGKALFHEDKVFRETIERCDALIGKQAGWSLLAELLADEPHSRLAQTEIAQPAIFSVQAALVARFRAWGIEPDAVVGHSVGEIAAAYAASVLSLDDAIRVVIHRARLMQSAHGKGRMAAIGLSYEEVERFVSAYPNLLSVAAVNSHKSTVLAGDSAALQEVLAFLKERNVFCRDLGVDYAFHTSQMDPLMPKLAETLAGLKPRAASIRMTSTVTGNDVRGDGLDGAHWARTMREPVRFADAMDRLMQDGYELFLEIGPSHVLGTPITECLRGRGLEGTVLASMRKGRDGCTSLLSAVGSLYVAGRDVDWNRVYRGRFVPLPTYPWQRKRYWLPNGVSAAKPPAAETARADSGQVSIKDGENVSTYYDRVVGLTEGQKDVFLTFAPFREPTNFSWLLALYEPDKHPEAVAHVKEAQKELRRVLFRGIDFASIRTALDIGCGYGSDLRSLAEQHSHLKLDGFTISPKQAEFGNREAKNRNLQDRISIYSQDSSKNDFPGRYDLVFGFEVAHYIDDKHKLFSNIDRHLNDGGFVVLADFVANTVSEIRDAATSSYFLTLEQWSELLASYKLRVVESVDVSAEMANFLHDPDEQKNLNLLSERAADGGLVRRHFASYEGLGRMFRKKLCTYALLTIQKDRYLTKDAILQLNRETLGSPTPYPEAAGWVETGTKTQSRLPLAAETGDWVYELDWRLSPPPKSVPASDDKHAAWLIFTDQSGVGEALTQNLQSLGQKFVTVTPGRKYERSGEMRFKLSPSQRDDFNSLLTDAFTGNGLACLGVIHLWGIDSTSNERTTPESLKADQELGCTSLLYVAQALSEVEGSGRPRLWVATSGAQAVDATSVLNVSQGPLWGLGRTIAMEQPGLWGGLIDLDSAMTGKDSAHALFNTIHAGDSENQVAWRRGERYAARLVGRRPESRKEAGSLWKSDGSYLLTGGLGALGLQVATRMIEAGAHDLILLQRSTLPARSTWSDVEKGSRLASQIATIQELESKGARVHVFSADVARADQVNAVFSEIRKSLPPLRGVIHAAGVLDDGILSQMSHDRFEQVMAPKIAGAWNLHRLTSSAPLDFFVCFSSLASMVGSPGQSNYAAANAGLDALMHYRRRMRLPALSINWGPWAEVGMAAADAKRGERVAQQGFGSIAPAQAVRLLEQLIQQDRPQLAVVALDIQRLQETTAVAKAPLFSELLSRPVKAAAPAAAVRTETKEEKSSIRHAIASADPDARRRLLQDYLTTEIATILQVAPSELNKNRSLNSLGIDSLMAVEIRNRIEKDLPVRVQISSILEGLSTNDLAQNLLSQMQSEPSAKSADRAARVAQEIGQMSDEAVRALLESKKQEANRRRLSK